MCNENIKTLHSNEEDYEIDEGSVCLRYCIQSVHVQTQKNRVDVIHVGSQPLHKLFSKDNLYVRAASFHMLEAVSKHMYLAMRLALEI
jgi:hypothetical protein